MASDSESADEVFSTDCATSGTDSGRRKRRASGSDLTRRVEGRRAKRSAPGRGSPLAGAAGADTAAPGAARPATAGLPRAAAVGLNEDSLGAIQQMIDAGISKVINVFDAKFNRLEKRISILESDGLERECEIKKTHRSAEFSNKAQHGPTETGGKHGHEQSTLFADSDVFRFWDSHS